MMDHLARNLTQHDSGIWLSPGSSEISYPEHGNQSCFEIEDQSFWFRHRNDCVKALVDKFPPPGGGTLFDIGGGNGFVAKGLQDAGYRVALVEPGPAGAQNAMKRGIDTVIQSTLQDAGFLDGVIDAAGMFDVIEHIEDDTGFLKELHMKMRANGRIYLTVPLYTWLWSDEDISAGHFRRYTPAALKNVLLDSGFETEFATCIFTFLPLPIFLLRSLPYRLGIRGSVVRSEANQKTKSGAHSSFSGFFDWLFDWEKTRIERLKPVKAGGSALVVARKTD